MSDLGSTLSSGGKAPEPPGNNPDTLTMLARTAAIPRVKGIELVGTWDVTPDTAAEMHKHLDGHGLQCVSVIPDLFTDARYAKGAYSAPDAAVRRHAIDDSKRMCEAASILGWLHQYGRVVERFRDEIDELLAQRDGAATSRFLRQAMTAFGTIRLI